MRFACYGRKSVFSDKSDSIDNQFRMCREHAELRFPGEVNSWEEYSDEDYTGANVNRPDLKRLIQDVTIGAIDVLIVYQLDRLSRDVRDFSNIYSVLSAHNVMFISLKETIDTTTPIGRAMMYVTVVFAAMERENIAARVTDNMIGLAKKGYWVGGEAPTGFVRMPIEVDGKKHVSLAPDPEGVAYMHWLFDTFLTSGKSLQAMETHFRKEGIRTRNGAFFSTTQLHSLLTQPFCVEATPEVFDFFMMKGCSIDVWSPRDKWDGTHGVMVYGRSTQRNGKHQKNPPEKWTVCIGYHKPFMPAEKWLAVQDRFAQNKFVKEMKYDVPLLRGVLRCSCGSAMLVSRKKKNEGVSSWYYCLRRMRQGAGACDRSQIKTDLLDEKVLEIFRNINHDPSLIRKYVDSGLPSDFIDPKEAAARVTKCESKIGRLAAALADADGSAAAKYIISEMEKLDLELQALKREHSIALMSSRRRDQALISAEDKVAEISNLIRGMDDFTAAEKNQIIRKILKRCEWNGKQLFIKI